MPARWLALAVSGLILCGYLSAQEKDCASIVSSARIARSLSATSLEVEKRKAGQSYRAQLVYSARRFELSPRDKSAALLLLNLMPRDGEQQLILTTLGTSMCDSESIKDMEILGRLEERLPRDFASAVLLVPQKIQAYVFYGTVAIGDPHSDFVIQMKRVCRTYHRAFINAANSLGGGSREDDNFATSSSEWFRAKIFDPAGCRPLMLPEAE